MHVEQFVCEEKRKNNEQETSKRKEKLGSGRSDLAVGKNKRSC